MRSQVTYLIALHELGHLIAPGNRGKKQLEREAHAWRWAFDRSLVAPTPHTCKRIFDYLSSYHRRATLRAALGRRVVAIVPDEDSDYWRLLRELQNCAQTRPRG